MHPYQNIQHKINPKSKARFGRLLRPPPTWKQNGPILVEIDKSGSKTSKEVNKTK